MKIGFFTIFHKDPVHYALAGILVRSIRTAMPAVEVVHFTDDVSPDIAGVDAVIRKPRIHMLELRMSHYAECNGDWLLLDTDTFVQKDVCHVFDRPFDVAMADREWNPDKEHYKYSESMPFNTGVVFTRTPAFYRLALTMWRQYTAAKRRQWWSEQCAVGDAAATQQFTIDVLPGMIYNRPPSRYTDDVSDAAILHYKGATRKLWMINRHQAEDTQRATSHA